jgi:universal stress protein A
MCFAFTLGMTNENQCEFHVVVGHDFSEHANRALALAFETARTHSAPVIHVLAVLGRQLPETESAVHPRTAEGAAELSQELETIVRAQAKGDEECPVRYFVHARIGSPAQEILRLAQETRADLIVVGTHGRNGLKRLALGSVAETVIRHACCPVLIAREGSYPTVDESEYAPEPACEDCVAIRRKTGGAKWWCSRHGGQNRYLPPQRYAPTNYGIVELHAEKWRLW